VALSIDRQQLCNAGAPGQAGPDDDLWVGAARENISLHATGALDRPSEKALIAELSVMNAGM